MCHNTDYKFADLKSCCFDSISKLEKTSKVKMAKRLF